jgi:hypothetical protein
MYIHILEQWYDASISPRLGQGMQLARGIAAGTVHDEPAQGPLPIVGRGRVRAHTGTCMCFYGVGKAGRTENIQVYREFMRMNKWYLQTHELREENRVKDDIAEILPSRLRQRSPKKAYSKTSNVVIS